MHPCTFTQQLAFYIEGVRGTNQLACYSEMSLTVSYNVVRLRLV